MAVEKKKKEKAELGNERPLDEMQLLPKQLADKQVGVDAFKKADIYIHNILGVERSLSQLSSSENCNDTGDIGECQTDVNKHNLYEYTNSYHRRHHIHD